MYYNFYITLLLAFLGKQTYFRGAKGEARLRLNLILWIFLASAEASLACPDFTGKYVSLQNGTIHVLKKLNCQELLWTSVYEPAPSGGHNHGAGAIQHSEVGVKAVSSFKYRTN